MQEHYGIIADFPSPGVIDALSKIKVSMKRSSRWRGPRPTSLRGWSGILTAGSYPKTLSLQIFWVSISSAIGKMEKDFMAWKNTTTISSPSPGDVEIPLILT